MQLFGRWAARDPQHRKDLHFGITSLILSLRTNFDPSLADGVHAHHRSCGPNDETLRRPRRAQEADRSSAGDPPDADATIAGDARGCSPR